MTFLAFLLLTVLNVCLAQFPVFTVYEVCAPPTDPDTGMLWEITDLQVNDFDLAFGSAQFLNPGNKDIQRIDFVDEYTPAEQAICGEHSGFTCADFFQDKEGRFHAYFPLKQTSYDPTFQRQYGEVQDVYVEVTLTDGQVSRYVYGSCDVTGRLGFYAEPWYISTTASTTPGPTTTTDTNTVPWPTTSLDSTTVGSTSARNSTVPPYTSSTIVSTGTRSGQTTSVTRVDSSISTVNSTPTGQTSSFLPQSKSVPATSASGNPVPSSAVPPTWIPITGVGSNTANTGYQPIHGTPWPSSLAATSRVPASASASASSALCPCAIQTATGVSSAAIVRTVTRLDLCPCAAQSGAQCACRSQALQITTEYMSVGPRATGIPNSAYCPCLAQSGSSGQGGGSDYDQGGAHPGGSGGVQQVGSAPNTVTVAVMPMILLGLVALS